MLKLLPGENMKDVIGYEGEYAVTEDGEVWSYKWNKWLKAHISCWNYYKVNLNKDAERKLKFVHRLVAEAFIDNPEYKDQVDHIDGNRLNNNLSNLRWVTNTENQQNRRLAKGYSWHKQKQKWQATICVDSKLKHLGYYETEAEAHQAYLEAKKIHHPSAPINNSFISEE